MVSLEKWMILTPLQLLPTNGGDRGKLIVAKCFKKLPKLQKIAQSGHSGCGEGERHLEMGQPTKKMSYHIWSFHATQFYDKWICVFSECRLLLLLLLPQRVTKPNGPTLETPVYNFTTNELVSLANDVSCCCCCCCCFSGSPSLTGQHLRRLYTIYDKESEKLFIWYAVPGFKLQPPNRESSHITSKTRNLFV